jgi:hypothetical protein
MGRGKGLRKRFYITGKIGPGGMKCTCCANTKYQRRKNKRIGKIMRAWEKRKWIRILKEISWF